MLVCVAVCWKQHRRCMEQAAIGLPLWGREAQEVCASSYGLGRAIPKYCKMVDQYGRAIPKYCKMVDQYIATANSTIIDGMFFP
ncbi:hypothetical protein EON63_02525 [archaeon]|nr:MAG: hypothetical protein EON63_02525 [archaeon]